MPSITRKAGIQLELPQGVQVTDLAPERPAGATRARGGSTKPLPRRRVSVEAGGATSTRPGPDPLVASMRSQDMELLDAFVMNVPAGAPSASRRPGEARGELSVDLAVDEDAVVLLETDGVYEWRYPDSSRKTVTRSARRGPVIEPASKVAVFDLHPTSPGEPAGRRARGPLADFIGNRVKAYVLKFLAGVAAEQSVKFLERNARRGLIVMDSDDPARWRRVEDMSGVDLPSDRPARILLFVHGTFSSTKGSFGALGASEWGRELLGAARRAYDLVIGYDHRTLSENPLENATDLLARLELGTFAVAPQIDAVAYSRGALVLRSLIEYLLPSSHLRARVRHAVFVGGTNGGTQLAEPANWERLVDLYTNLAVAGSRALDLLASPVAGLVLRESVSTLGALVKYMSAAAVAERRVPGLSAMEPDGPFVSDLNTMQPGQPGAADALYYVVSSNFDVEAGKGAPELSARLRRWILDGFSDRLLGEANDLVVHTAAMSAIDAGAGAFVKDTLALGRNPHVYHTIYFTRPEVAAAVARWLSLAAPSVPAAGRRSPGAVEELPAIADPSLYLAQTDDAFADVLQEARRADAHYVVLRRATNGYYYAFTRDEMEGVRGMLTAQELRSPDLAVWRALERSPQLKLQEDRASRTLPMGTSLSELSAGSPAAHITARRIILLDGTVPRAVVEPQKAVAPLEELVRGPARRMGRSASRPPAAAAPGARAPIRGSRGGARAAPPPPSASRPPSRPRAAAAPAVPAMAGEPRGTTAPFFFSATMPGTVAVEETTQVFVTISRDEIERTVGGLTEQAGTDVDLERTLIVQVIAKRNFKTVGEDRAEVDPSAKRRFELMFEVKATHADPGELWVLVRQGAETLVTLKLRPTVLRAGAATALESTRTLSATAEAAATGGGRYPVLQIFEEEDGGAFTYHFSLDLGDGSYYQGDSPRLRVDRAAYVAGMYREIEDRWLSHKQDLEAFEQDMRGYGGALFDELIPLDLQAPLWKVRDTLKVIQVVSEEPFVPWEVVHLKPPRAPGGPPSRLPPDPHFLAQMGLMRWLHNHHRAPRDIKVRPGRAYFVVPDYPDKDYKLPEALAEIPFLKKKLHAVEWAAEVNAVRTLLSDGGGVDLFHFSGHGEAVAQTSQQETARAQLLLEGRMEQGKYVPLFLDAETVQQYGNLTGEDGNQPLVVLNACQVGRASWKLTSIGGFAEAFIRAGAGAFVGTLWSVGDQPARNFTEGFYQALIDGRTVAEATLRGREAARLAGEATWLAYVVYGHPQAVVHVESMKARRSAPDTAVREPAGT